METRAFTTQVTEYLRAGFPALWVQTWEEARVETLVRDAAEAVERGVWRWSITRGWVNSATKQAERILDPIAALDRIVSFDPQKPSLPENCVYVMRDFHPYMAAPDVHRRIRDLLPVLSKTGRTLLFTAPVVRIPIELEKAIVALDLSLPALDELGATHDFIVRSAQERNSAIAVPDAGLRDAVINAARGLTEVEAENIFSLAVIRHGGFNADTIKTIQQEKARILKQSELLEYYEPRVNLASVGGLDLLKAYLQRRTRAFSPAARAYGLQAPRGLLLVGVQGCGKSLVAKAIADDWRQPLLRFDVGRVFGQLVGASEENMRRVMAIAEAMSPCILWIDEMEKGFAGIQSSGQTDAGTSARVFGSFLTWLAEKTAPVYVVATVNLIEHMPPEIVRKGRFDEVFFIDLPLPRERSEILAIHLTKRGRDPKRFSLAKLAAATEQFSGAELEQAVLDGMTAAFAEDGREVTTKDILTAIEDTKPLAVTMAAAVGRTREWAQDRARRATSPADDADEAKGRKLVGYL